MPAAIARERDPERQEAPGTLCAQGLLFAFASPHSRTPRRLKPDKGVGAAVTKEGEAIKDRMRPESGTVKRNQPFAQYARARLVRQQQLLVLGDASQHKFPSAQDASRRTAGRSTKIILPYNVTL